MKSKSISGNSGLLFDLFIANFYGFTNPWVSTIHHLPSITIMKKHLEIGAYAKCG